VPASTDPFEGLFGRAYDAYIKRPALARVIGRALWAADPRPMYSMLGEIGEAPGGATILDAPCGGGLAFRGLHPDQDVRYIAADLARQMLDRARREAERRGLTQVEFLHADVQRLPLDDGTADLTLSMNSLHCIPDPAAAVAELARCTTPGARFIGSTLVFGAGRRPDAGLRRGQRDGAVGPSGRRARWTTSAAGSATLASTMSRPAPPVRSRCSAPGSRASRPRRPPARAAGA
jgi:SAM-dependent methyltransferase